VWRYYLLKGYALVVGAGILVLGLLGASPVPPHPPHLEYVLHIGAGALFMAGGWLLDDFGHLRGFVGAMGALRVVAKVGIVGVRSIGVAPIFLPGVGYVCLVIGACSLLVALFIGRFRG
jgi:hypothetical protein